MCFITAIVILSQESHWVYQPYSGVGHLLRSSWPAQNKLHVYVCMCVCFLFPFIYFLSFHFLFLFSLGVEWEVRWEGSKRNWERRGRKVWPKYIVWKHLRKIRNYKMMYFLHFCFHFLVASDGVITQWKKYGFYLHEVICHTLECLFIQLLNFLHLFIVCWGWK